MSAHYLPYARQQVTDSDIKAAAAALADPIITRGSNVEQFENLFAEYCGAKSALAFHSGSTALQAACVALEVSRDDRAIVTPNTFIATVASPVQCGAEPIFVDIDNSSGNMDLDHVCYTLERPASRGRNLIMPVHFSGIPVDMVELDQRIKDPNCVVIEDGCHALGSRYTCGRRVGSCHYSQMTVFSFHPAKIITTCEGGMVTTNDERLYKRLRLFRNSGIERDPRYLDHAPQPWHYDVEEISSNYNFTEMQAALGVSQLQRIDSFVERRRALVAKYRKLLQGKEHIVPLTDCYDHNTAFHLFVVLVDFASCGKTRDTVMQRLHSRQIGTQLHYMPIYRHRYFQTRLGDLSQYFPKAERHFSQALSLPLYPELTDEDIARVVNELCRALS